MLTMSENFSDLTDDPTEGNRQEPSGGDLRRQLEAALAKNKELAEFQANTVAAQRQEALTTKATEKGLDPEAIKALMPAGLEDEAADKWLDAFAQATNAQAPAANTQEPGTEGASPTHNLAPEEVAELESLAGAGGHSGPSVPADIASKLDAVQTEDQLWALFGGDGQ